MRKRAAAKILAYWIIFLMLHFAYKYVPILPFKLIGATDESLFQNQKVGFFAYVLVNGLEYLVRRKEIEDRESFFHTRLFTSLIIPWFTFIVWYMASAYYGRLPSDFLEILYSNIAVIVVAVCILVVEHGLEGIKYSRPFKSVLWVLFLVLVSQYVIFTFRLPWADVFIDVYSGGS